MAYKKLYDVIIIGGGAAGFFSAVNIAEKYPGKKICILEKSSKLLSKVKVSGGGRCNFTHSCYDPAELVKFYPRGSKELLGPFHKFAAGDTIEWFQSRGVDFYIADDGSIFPKSDDSQTIIDLFLNLAGKFNVDIFTGKEVVEISAKGPFLVKTTSGDFTGEKLIISSGSNRKTMDLLKELGHEIVKPLPSLFTFKISDKRIDGLMGLVVENVLLSMSGSKIAHQSGPLLITHWGMSGPSVLKLSAFGAREMSSRSYQFKIKVNWLFNYDHESLIDEFLNFKKTSPKKKVLKSNRYKLPNRLWQNLLAAAGIDEKMNWADLSSNQLNKLATELTEGEFRVNGRFKFKEEFVTAGGVSLKEIDFRKFESKIHKNMFLAGEVLDIDAVTGGFNFQNAWTGAWIISENIFN